MKVQLVRERLGPGMLAIGGIRQLTQALPFYRSPAAHYVHRVRSGLIHTDDDGTYRHTSIRFWCGGHGFLGGCKKRKKYGQLLAVPPENEVFCATCEGRAIGAGLAESRVICGRFVAFQPRQQ